MPADISYNESTALIEIIYSGKVTASELHDAVQRRVALQKETGARGILADATQVHVTPSTMTLFDLPSRLFPELDERKNTLIALVLPFAKEPREMASFLETASRNRGWSMRAFEDHQSALAWLLEQTASNNDLQRTK